jgi:hypothetical protein
MRIKGIMIAIVLVSPPAWAGSVAITQVGLDEGLTTALLEASSQRHVDAMRRLIAKRFPGAYEARRWEDIENHMRREPIARFEYEYRVGGRMAVRTYHSLGGEPLGRIAHTSFEGELPGSRPGTPDSSSEWDADDEFESHAARASDDELAAAEAADEAFYEGFDEVDVRAPFRPRGRSVMKPFWYEGRHHGLDAEHKAMRSIEEDILDGKIPRGGRIRGLLSAPACTACRSQIQRFADTYELNIELGTMSSHLPVRTEEALIRSGRARLKGLRLVDPTSGRPILAYDVLAGARDGQIRENLTPVARERAASGTPWQRRSFRFSLGPVEPASGPQTATDEATEADTPGC